MKNVLVSLLLFATIISAQNNVAKSDSVVAQDSVRISDLVQKQIQQAKEKQSVNVLLSAYSQKEKISVEAQIAPPPAKTIELMKLFNDQPLHIKIFEMTSLAIFLFVLIRRIGFGFKKKSLRILKDKIQMLRLEKIAAKENPKLKKSRETLLDNEKIYRSSGKQLSKAAKKMNIAKGELLLAARLKLFEVGKL